MGETEIVTRAPFGRRITAFDGLRGLAALVVLVHHSLLTFPALAAPYYGQHVAPGSLAWLLTYTPLHLMWAGTEGVYLFFILSGIVLTMPTLRGPTFEWRRYYPRRLVRLYIPVFAAVAFGALTILFVGRLDSPELGAWVVARPNAYDAPSLFSDLTLIFGTSRVVSPLWSLQWEVLFSLLLPLYVLCFRSSRLWWVKLAVIVGMIAVGALISNPVMFYMPMFGIGALLASRWEWVAGHLASWFERAWVGPSLLLCAVGLTCIRWEVAAFGVPYSSTTSLGVVSVVGVTLLILVGALWRPFSRLLELPLMQWFGAVSFSLYLVHEPVILAFRFLTADLSPRYGLLIAVPVSIAVAALFLKLVERPSHRLAQRLGASPKRNAPTQDTPVRVTTQEELSGV